MGAQMLLIRQIIVWWSSCVCVNNAMPTVSPTDQNWPALKTTFGKFNNQPRTVCEAEALGWIMMSECDSNVAFAGHQYADPSDPSLVILMDDAGYIAGVQSVVLEEYINITLFDPRVNPSYIFGTWFEKDAWITTMYFVDPSIICNGGRTEEEWNTQGTGDRLAMQYGPTPADLIRVPLTQAEAEKDDLWFDHLCLPGMGEHFNNFNYEPNQDCGVVLPLQILYDSGRINGFVFGHLADIPGDKWEHPDAFAISVIFYQAPTCLKELVISGLSSMHHYIYNTPQLTVCPTNETFAN